MNFGFGGGSGKQYVKSGSGAPSGSAPTGQLYVDTTNNSLWQYSGSAWVVTGGPSSALVPNGRLYVPPIYYQTGSDEAVQLNTDNKAIAMKFVPTVDMQVAALSVYVTAVGTPGYIYTRIFSDSSTGLKPGSNMIAQNDSVNCTAADTWHRRPSFSSTIQLQRGVPYWAVFSRVIGSSTDISLSTCRWNTSLGSMFPCEHVVTKYTDDAWSTYSDCTDDSKPAMLNIVMNSAAEHVPMLIYGRYNGKYIYIPGVGMREIPATGVMLSLATGYDPATLYYVYIYDNSGTLTLNVSTTAPTLTEGILVKTGATTYRYLGKVYLKTLVNTYEGPVDCMDSRLVMNHYNKIPKRLGKLCPYSANTYDASVAAAAWEQWYEDGDNFKFEFLSDGINKIDIETECIPNVQAYVNNFNTGIALDGEDHAVEGGHSFVGVWDETGTKLMVTQKTSSTIRPSPGYHYAHGAIRISAGGGCYYYYNLGRAQIVGTILC